MHKRHDEEERRIEERLRSAEDWRMAEGFYDSHHGHIRDGEFRREEARFDERELNRMEER